MFSIVLKENIQTYSPWRGQLCCVLSPWSVRYPRLSTESLSKVQSRDGEKKEGNPRAERKGQDTESLNREEGSLELRGELHKPKDSGLEYEKGIRNSPEKDQKWIGDGEQNKYKNPKAPDPGS